MDNYYLSIIKPEYYRSIEEYRRQMIDSGSDFHGCASLDKYEDIEKWHLNCKLFENVDTLPPLYSLAYEYLFMDDEEVVGMVNIRPEALNHPYLKEYGGHIGYSIKPSKRDRGLGTLMLKKVLELCKREFGLNKVLITCHEDNEASKTVIMNNGGVYDNKKYYSPDDTYLERYWISI